MKFAIISLLTPLALAAAHPAPAPEAVIEPITAAAPAAQPDAIDLRDPNHEKTAVALQARYAGIVLESRDPAVGKGGKGRGGGGNSTDTNAAITIAPARALQVGALGLGVMEIVRFWV